MKPYIQLESELEHLLIKHKIEYYNTGSEIFLEFMREYEKQCDFNKFIKYLKNYYK